MMSRDQIKVVIQVYNHLIENEKRGWDGLDDYLDCLDYLDDDQLHREAEIIYSDHKSRAVKCQQDHTKDKCFVPLLVEAVNSIVDLYKETGELHIKNKYILQYYIAMNQAGLIVVEQT